MKPWIMAILLRPLATILIFVTIVAPITWLLYKILPEGKWKFTLFKVRTGKFSTRRDKVMMTLVILGCYVIGGLLLYLFYGF